MVQLKEVESLAFVSALSSYDTYTLPVVEYMSSWQRVLLGNIRESKWCTRFQIK